MDRKHQSNPAPKTETAAEAAPEQEKGAMPEEVGGSGKAEPTRYGDWEVNGRCSDF